MMQLGQQSRWQSWMRMLALNIRPAHEPRLSTAEFTTLALSIGAGQPLIGTFRLPLDAIQISMVPHKPGES